MCWCYWKAIAEFYGKKVNGLIGDSENFENLLGSKTTNEHLTKKNKTNKAINNILTEDASIIGGACPLCGSVMQIKDGCMGGVCSNPDCGFSECG